MYGYVYSNVMNIAKTDSFASDGVGEVLLGFILLVVIVAIHLFIVQWLWNSVLVRVLTVAKPIPSLLYTFGLLILIGMLFPGSL